MVNANESFLEESVTEIAVIVGFANDPPGTIIGGVYFALKLGDPTALSVPQSGLHGTPAAVNVHTTPAAGGSFKTVAFTLTAGAPISCAVNLLVIVTATGGTPVEIENVKLANLIGEATEVAVITGFCAGPVGIVAGG